MATSTGGSVVSDGGGEGCVHGVCVHTPRPRGRHTPRGQTNTRENSALPQTLFMGGTHCGLISVMNCVSDSVSIADDD